MKTIKIGCIDYAIDIVDLLEDDERKEIFGQLAYDECEIRILDRLAPQAKIAILWHEILHAILVEAGFVGEHDEHMVSAIAHGISAVLKNNPKIEIDGNNQ
ncbi:hypothetical protein LCGC14_0928510 [marine sediment metagenome]|uniref:Metallopeptidase domain-containing protein n=1 Tax=marine sediment metagenome TaxID=412755 RepID=A0A0F9M1M8_9ZZZZ